MRQVSRRRATAGRNFDRVMHDKNTAVTEVVAAPTEKTSMMAAYYAVGMLTLIYALNFLDRTVITILIDPIKRDYHLSDKMMGFISGVGFVVMYSLLAAPVARWADRSNRRSIITWGLVLWSVVTALAGFARKPLRFTFTCLGVRLGGAAGTVPPG